jgi:peptidyl-prolyl cis-trans isomerase D
MLSSIRKVLDNWVARVFFGGLIVIFVFWGISNVQTLVGSNTAVAHIGGKPVDISEVQAEYQRELNQSNQSGTPDLSTRQQIAQSALVTVLRQHALSLIEDQLGIAAPDAALRARIYAIPAFQTNGVFDQAKFNLVLQQNDFSPDRFLNLERANLANSQLIEAITAGAAPPAPLVDQIFAYVSQARTAETVNILTAAQPKPALPSDAVLQRYWKNHPQAFTAPEYRTIKLVILSPQLMAPNEPVSAAELAAAYAQVAAQDHRPASRSVQVITSQDAKKAAALAASWSSGADWPAMQAAATKAGATAVELDHAQANQIPSQVLSTAVFAAAPNTVSGPVQGPFGYYVFKVTAATAAGAPPLAQLAPQLRKEIQLQKAQADVNQDVNNVQDALAGQTPLDQLPGNLGLIALMGTLDAKGNALDGAPAPIPGGAGLKNAIVKAVFAGHLGDAPQLMNGPDDSYFAFTISTITPPAVQPYDQVKTAVAAAWESDQLTREAEVKAADLLAAVNAGQNFDTAATAAGNSVAMTPPVTRSAPPAGIPADMVPVLFTLKPGQATMEQTPDGFVVAGLATISQPTPANDPQDAAGIEQALTKSLQNDAAESFLSGLQARDNVKIDPKLFAQIYQ